ncbi:MAG: L-threonylcarbamoyladenylate synthase [Kiritimatiellae bacterium]|nr:L-threonylcarbamoyladenylate synthase [Kiritimatiellia bacterium]
MLTSTPGTLAEAARLLNNGGVVVLPTDTVYGIAAHPAHPAAVARIRVIKGRADDKPVALLASGIQAVTAFGAAMPPAARKLAETYWPGALTMVLPCGQVYEGFRVPDHPFTRALLEACGGTLRVTSANLSGSMPALSAAAALRDVGLEADMVIDGGISPEGVASTVIRVSEDGAVQILREGALAATEILRASLA